ncbi:hypothetical protein [Streptomyces sp. NPDC055085]
MVGDDPGILLPDRPPGDPYLTLVESHQIRHRRVAAHGDRKRGECPRPAGHGFVHHRLRLAHPVISTAERLGKKAVAFPKFT